MGNLILIVVSILSLSAFSQSKYPNNSNPAGGPASSNEFLRFVENLDYNLRDLTLSEYQDGGTGNNHYSCRFRDNTSRTIVILSSCYKRTSAGRTWYMPHVGHLTIYYPYQGARNEIRIEAAIESLPEENPTENYPRISANSFFIASIYEGGRFLCTNMFRSGAIISDHCSRTNHNYLMRNFTRNLGQDAVEIIEEIRRISSSR